MLENDKNKIKETTDDMISNVESRIGKEMVINFLPKILGEIDSKDETDVVRINNFIRLTLATIKKRVNANTNTRTLNLENTITESHGTSKKMLAKTINVASSINKNPVVEIKSNPAEKNKPKKKVKKAA